MGNNPYSILMVMGYLFFQVYAVFYIMVLLDMTGTSRQYCQKVTDNNEMILPEDVQL